MNHWREQLYLQPLYNQQWLRERPRLHTVLIALLDAALLVPTLLAMFSLCLFVGWSLFNGLARPEGGREVALILIVCPLIGFFVISAVILSVGLVIALIVACCGHAPHYIIPSAKKAQYESQQTFSSETMESSPV